MNMPKTLIILFTLVAFHTNATETFQEIDLVNNVAVINSKQPYVHVTCEKKEGELHYLFKKTPFLTPAYDKCCHGLLLVMSTQKDNGKNSHPFISLSEIQPDGSPKTFVKATTKITPLEQGTSMCETSMARFTKRSPNVLQEHVIPRYVSSNTQNEPKTTAYIDTFGKNLEIRYYFPESDDRTVYGALLTLSFYEFPNLVFVLGKRTPRSPYVDTQCRCSCSQDRPNGHTTTPSGIKGSMA